MNFTKSFFAVVLLLAGLGQAAAAGSCSVAVVSSLAWIKRAEANSLVLTKAGGVESLMFNCSALDHDVSDKELLLAAGVEEPEEAYCCNRFGSFRGFEERHEDGHHEWWLKKSRFLVHIVSNRKSLAGSNGREVEEIIKGMSIK